ncbi:MAG: hypothetical protein N3D12_02125 [Candidatus Methanomethyliaceae archaeon]|nr:hypothetical protein [Candidatus Methanomethyliaceae archaeon]
MYEPWYLEGISDLPITFLGDAKTVDLEYLKEGEQKENLCGPFAAAYILRALGFRQHGGNFVDQEYVAYLASTRVNMGEGRLYKYPLAETTSPAELGTSAAGMKHAIETISEGRLVALPVKTTDRSLGPLLDRERLEVLIRVFANIGDVQLIFNLNTKHLLEGPDLNRRLLALEGDINLSRLGLRRRDGVGHFVSCAGFVRAKKMFFIIRESYKKFGVQLQPFEAILEGLNRYDGREGGILAILPKGHEEALVEELQGFELSLWDNGSPF